MQITLEILTAPELAPARHGFFTRKGGASSGVFAGLNCGAGSSDQAEAVALNRARVAEALGVAPEALVGAHQVHSPDVVTVTDLPLAPQRADALVTATPGVVLTVLTADCQPVLFLDPEARVVGAAHAGWKGALGGVTDAAIAAMEARGARRGRIVAAVGPCIAQPSYEVDTAFAARFAAADPANARFFRPGKPGHAQFDLEGYVAARLEAAGVAAVDRLTLDTCADEARFFSYRRASLRAEPSYGRQISLIGLP